jgi:hypothetical protein
LTVTAKLSQAAAIRGEERNNTQMDFPARNVRHATQASAKKQRRSGANFKLLIAAFRLKKVDRKISAITVLGAQAFSPASQ